MPHGTTIRTNGQTLTVQSSVSYWTTEALALVGSGDDDVASTTTTTITADTTLWFANDATTATITIKQPDGTTIGTYTGLQVNPGVGPRTLNPVPDGYQSAGDLRPPLWDYITGQYYFASPPTGGSTKAADLNYAAASMYYVPSTVSIAKIGAEVTSAGSAGAVFRIGIWAPSTSVSGPGALVADCGTIDGTSATVQDITLASPLVLKPGAYWFGGASQVAACTYRSIVSTSASPGTPMGTTIPSAAYAAGCVAYAGATGAFAATFGTPVAAAMTSAPRLHFKVS